MPSTGRHALWSVDRDLRAVARYDRRFVPRFGHRSDLRPVPPIPRDCLEEWRCDRRVPVGIVNCRYSSGLLLSLRGYLRGGPESRQLAEIAALHGPRCAPEAGSTEENGWFPLSFPGSAEPQK